MPKLLAMPDLHGGFLTKVIALPAHRQERTCLTRLFTSVVAAGAVMLGDRGLAGFAQLAMARQRAVDALIRLPRWLVVSGRGKGAHRRLRRPGRQDLLVSWRRQGLRRPRWMSKLRWGELPRDLTLRQVAFRIVRPGHRTHWAWIVTTLTDPETYPAEELVQPYAKRWQVEVCFRDLKRTLGLRKLSARTVAGVRKELLAFVLLYNLVRRVVLEAAARQRTDPQRISFTDAVTWLLWSSPGDDLPRLRVNPVRRRPSQPRKLKNARKRYTQLNAPRERLTKPPCEAKL